MPKSLQVNRGLLYLLPIYYLFSLKIIEFSKSRLINFTILLLIFSSIFMGYSINFSESPGLYKEIAYIDNNIYLDVTKYCQDKLIITSGRPWILLFYSTNPKYYLNTKYWDNSWGSDVEGPNFAYFNYDENRYFDVYTNTPLIQNFTEFKYIINNNAKICYISGGLPKAWVNQEAREFIENNVPLYNSYRTNYDDARMYLYIKKII